jgi:hypothetical protein
VKVPAYKALDHKLTDVAAEPGNPPRKCKDYRTDKPTVCNEDTMRYIDALRAWGRSLASQLREIAGLQP